MTFKQEFSKPVLVRHHGMKCLDCKVIIHSKAEVMGKKHRGHRVVYQDKNGEPAR